ncbi:MAG TPA: LysE family transporter [Candidatus Binatia bacterium]|jgi:threonine/homoserine/homoserine lactone efflux protein
MSVYLLLQGIVMGLVVAVPVGPLGLLCISRALMVGPACGLFSGLGVATADALAAGIAALGITLISSFLRDYQLLFRLLGGTFLCYLGYNICVSEPASPAPVKDFNSLASAYATTFLLTFSNPLTIFSFVAIYAGWQLPSVDGHYVAAATLTVGVFTGSALWWVGLFIGLTTFHHKLNLRFLYWVHRVSGVIIAGFGVLVLLTLSPLGAKLGIRF